MNRDLMLFFFLMFFLITGNVCGQEPPALAPNVILIVSSGHGYSDLGCYGNNNVKTPFLDDLAHKGILMMNTFAASACYDSNMSVILTGFYNHATGQYGTFSGYSHFSIFPEIKNLPVVLHTAGYQTARCGKFTLGANSVFPFDTVIGSDLKDRSIYELADRCSGLFNHDSRSPFFLLFNTADPDRSYECLADDPDRTDLFGNIETGYPGILPKHYSSEKLIVPRYLPDNRACRNELSAYYQAITRMDVGIGRLMYGLKKSGKWDQTLVIYVSADAPAFPGIRNTLCDQGIRIPCIVKLPASQSGICYNFASLSDIFPTILDYCNAFPVDLQKHGKSLRLKFSVNLPVDEHEDVFISQTCTELGLYYPMRLVRNKQFKLIWNCTWQLPFPMSGSLKSSATWQAISNLNGEVGGKSQKLFFQRTEFELYDVLSDPNESVNLAMNPEKEQFLKMLKGRMETYMISTGDPWLSLWTGK